MVTIKLSKFNADSQSPFNKLIFENELEARNWFLTNQKNTLEHYKVNSVAEFIECGYYECDNAVEGIIPNVCATWEKTPTKGVFSRPAAEAYILSELEIIPTVELLEINGTKIDCRLADDSTAFSSKLKEFIKLQVIELLKKGVPVKTITVNGENFTKYFSLILHTFLSYEEAFEIVFTDIQYVKVTILKEDTHEVVKDNLRREALDKVKTRLENLEAVASALKKVL
jgi:hypothetical protein